MPPELKICGLTRAIDAAEAARVGARYAGVIFAGGPRTLDPERATAVLDAAGAGVQRVGVFPKSDPGDIARVVEHARLDVAQLHGDPESYEVEAMRQRTAAAVWAVCRIAGARLPANLGELLEVADAVVLDAHRDDGLGGTGTRFEWEPVARALASRRGSARIVLAGGLRPDNVAAAIACFAPDVIDVSSGVEVEPGIKDHAKVRAMAARVLHPQRAEASR